MRTPLFLVVLIVTGLVICLAETARAETDLRLLGGRFRVAATWRTADGAGGAAQAVPMTGETGLFWFFSPTNIELVVKVLDACAPPFGSFWVYAAGLTDVEVDLTVVDTWTGETKTYHRPGGTLFTPLADTSTFNGCSVVATSCGQGTEEEIAATPRPNLEAEVIAELLGSGITADPGIYARVDADLARIRALYPSLTDVDLLGYWEPYSLLVELTPSAHAAALEGRFGAWNCLNEWYHGQVFNVHEGYPMAVLHFEGFLHPARIGVDYAALPGVTGVSPNTYAYPGISLDSLCVAADGPSYDYFFQAFVGAQEELEATFLRVPQPGAAPILLGHAWLHGGPTPSWWPAVERCQEKFLQGAYR